MLMFIKLYCSSSDSENDEVENNRSLRRTNIENYIENTVPKYSAKQFREHFRVNRGTSLLSLLKNLLYMKKIKEILVVGQKLQKRK
ncbi:hypothetical protein ABEB36_003596 [Hypothenemus hampei]|uniref:Uncharacterized protein n=1 Tax=Hypothenemus hampei TaxID=57062 RepID=A0ABD1F9S6_HYPHA